MTETVDKSDRYHILGFTAVEHEDDNRDLTSDQQRKNEEIVVYTTNSLTEAESIRQAGGFISPDTSKWTVVTGYRDAAKPEKKPIEKGN